MKPRRDGDVELHESGYWDFSFCTGIGGSGGVGGSVGLDGADDVGSGAGVGGGCGTKGSAGSIGGRQLCVEVVSESSSGGFVVVVVLEDLRLVLWSG